MEIECSGVKWKVRHEQPFNATPDVTALPSVYPVQGFGILPIKRVRDQVARADASWHGGTEWRARSLWTLSVLSSNRVS